MTEDYSKVYDEIYDHFSSTRYKIWSGVKRFLDSMLDSCLIYEAGCGNGKNFIKKNMKGSDICQKLVDVCLAKGYNVVNGDVCDIKEPSDTYDATLCIAVIHHLDLEEKRLKAIDELKRITKSGGKVLITVWAHELNNPEKNGQDRIIPWNKKGVIYNRYYHYFTRDEIMKCCESVGFSEIEITEEMGNWHVICVK